MLEKLMLETFTGRVGEVFTVSGSDVPTMELRLAEASAWGAPQNGGRQPFSLIFHGPMEPVMWQRIAPVSHAELGEMEIFLVPIGPERGVMRYQAVFS